MNVFSHLKKIFNSFDFMGNRIKRLRVDTPENFINEYELDDKKKYNPVYRESLNPDVNTPDKVSEELKRNIEPYNESKYDNFKDFVANKEYVDKSVDYNTELAKNQEKGTQATNEGENPTDNDLKDGKQGTEGEINRNPSQFPFLQDDLNIQKNGIYEKHKGLFGLTVKEVLDRLLYPRLPHKYKFPKIKNIQFKTDNFLIECLEQNAITNKFLLNIGVVNNLYVNIDIDNGDWININNAKILIYLKDNIIPIEFSLKKGVTNVVGNGSIDLGRIKNIEDIDKILFQQEYSEHYINYDTWGYISKPKDLKGNEITKYLMSEDITEEFFKQCYFWKLQQLLDDNLNFIKEIVFNPLDIDNQEYNEEYNIVNLKVFDKIATDYYLKYYIYNIDGKLLNTGYISQKEIDSNGKINEYNFGVYQEQVKIKFKPIPVTTNTGYVQKN